MTDSQEDPVHNYKSLLATVIFFLFVRLAGNGTATRKQFSYVEKTLCIVPS